MREDRRFIQALPKDNPHLPDSYIQKLLNLDKNSKERLYYGNWEYDDDPATLITYDAIIDYFNPVHIKPEGKKYLTIDVARLGKDKTVFRVWHGFLCIKRVEMPKSLIPEIVDKAKEIMQEYGIAKSQTIADEDGVGGGVVDMLRCKGFVNNSAPLKEKQGNKWVKGNYDNLKSQCSYNMAKKIEAREAGEINTFVGVQDLVSEEMQQIKQKDIDKDSKVAIIPKDLIKEKIGRSPDDWDSIMMRWFFELFHVIKIEIK